MVQRISYALIVLVLSLQPSGVSAAFTTPGDLFSAIRTSSAKSFRVEAHAAMADGTYVSIWASGKEQGTDAPTMRVALKATVDVVNGDMNVRAKTEAIILDGMLYLKINGIDGSFDNEFAKASTVVRQLKWIVLPLDEYMLDDILGSSVFSVSSTDPVMADSMFTLASRPSIGGTTHTVGLLPAFAAELSQSIRDVLHDTEPISDDFFPFRALAEGMFFDMTVQTNESDVFVSLEYSLRASGKKATLRVSGSETVLQTPFSLQAPDGAVNMMQALEMLGAFRHLSDNDEAENMTNETLDDFFDDVPGEDLSVSVPCDGLDAIVLLQKQRQGECPVVRARTRR